jgi:DNA-damage-inducible protein J
MYIALQLHYEEKGVTMSTTSLNVRVEEELKKQAEALFAELGLNMSSALNIFLHEAVRYGGIPFVLRIEKPNAGTRSAINDVNNKKI